jgi:holo-[acyl-carrier protein] synthase
VADAVIGIGTDLVDLDRFRAVLARTPRIAVRLFTDAERDDAGSRRDPTESLGARFAAKEAAMKALGVGIGAIDFRDVEVIRLGSGAPTLAVHGRAAKLASERRVAGWLVSLSHTEHLAHAMVTALGDGT